jgi:hypothetical protein
MSRRSSSEGSSLRRQVVAAIRSGRITAKEVMAHLGIPAAVVGGWVRAETLRRSGRTPGSADVGATSSPFARVVLSRGRSARAIARLRGGRRLEVEAGFDAEEIRRLVEVLESC